MKTRRSQSRWGFTRQPESPNVHILGSRSSKTPPKFNEKTQRERKRTKAVGGGKKSEILGGPAGRYGGGRSGGGGVQGRGKHRNTPNTETHNTQKHTQHTETETHKQHTEHRAQHTKCWPEHVVRPSRNKNGPGRPVLSGPVLSMPGLRRPGPK